MALRVIETMNDEPPADAQADTKDGAKVLSFEEATKKENSFSEVSTTLNGLVTGVKMEDRRSLANYLRGLARGLADQDVGKRYSKPHAIVDGLEGVRQAPSELSYLAGKLRLLNYLINLFAMYTEDRLTMKKDLQIAADALDPARG